MEYGSYETPFSNGCLTYSRQWITFIKLLFKIQNSFCFVYFLKSCVGSHTIFKVRIQLLYPGTTKVYQEIVHVFVRFNFVWKINFCNSSFIFYTIKIKNHNCRISTGFRSLPSVGYIQRTILQNKKTSYNTELKSRLVLPASLLVVDSTAASYCLPCQDVLPVEFGMLSMSEHIFLWLHIKYVFTRERINNVCNFSIQHFLYLRECC